MYHGTKTEGVTDVRRFEEPLADCHFLSERLPETMTRPTLRLPDVMTLGWVM